MITAAEIRKKYPNPTVMNPTVMLPAKPVLEEAGYCIGGALYAVAVLHRPPNRISQRFPASYMVREALLVLNPKLPFTESRDFSVKIVLLNDNKKFEEAWKTVDEALRWPDVHNPD